MGATSSERNLYYVRYPLNHTMSQSQKIVQLALFCFSCVDMIPVATSLKTALMELKAKAIRRKMVQCSVRIFQDQIEKLDLLAQDKYRGQLNRSDLIRIFLDKQIEPELLQRG
jgi:hypothetical protein